MQKELLIINLRDSDRPSWDYLSDDLWEKIVQDFIADLCNSFSMDCLSDSENLKKLTPFLSYQPRQIGVKKYSPFHVPMNIEFPKEYTKELPAFEFDSHVSNLLLQVEFGSWNAGNEATPADEIIFWQKEKEKILAVPYEGMIYFYNLTSTERKKLLDVDRRIESNLHFVP